MAPNIKQPSEPQVAKFTTADFKSPNTVRWCPGCGDYAILNALYRAMTELGTPPEDNVVVSGIGCSSRLPYYMNTYGMHTIHGRGAAMATGVKVANPHLSVWLATGDGDSLAIGGNHFIHALRRNVDINIILFNNKIYGLTKGQYSPTSPLGFVTKTSPYGTVEEPFEPAELVFGARGHFFARSTYTDLALTTKCLVASDKHQGATVVEVLVNCAIFNDGIHKLYTDRATKDDHTILLQHGEPMIFGKERNRGLILDGLQLRAVELGEEYSEADLLIHDAHTPSATLHTLLANMHHEGLPLALGIIRQVEAPTYDQEVARQVAEVTEQRGATSIQDHLNGLSNWEVK